jgi:HK97 family phage portal protein
MSDEAFNRYEKTMTEKYSGLKNSNRLIFLEEGLKFTQLTIPPESAQFLETRKFQVIEIARFFNVPPHMIMDLERATFSNIEQQSLGYVMYSLMPWLVKWEQAIFKDLLTPTERKKFFSRFTVAGLLRGDFKTRMEGYHIMLQDGVYNADEIREMEDMNPQNDGQGQIYYVNGNMIPKAMAGLLKGKGGDNGAKGNNGEGTAQ